ncbi:hypothetical protein PHPALM_28420 [Phytophthora palmivora]|uniref:Uncharacterized protein n=1 Tax=Phytophthora palmivora TaxID=4796 RepID=A0A2P4XA47_9STRA|nr:hypothetical protein PHPALM_28420 [Phytophthora palmivora]
MSTKVQLLAKVDRLNEAMAEPENTCRINGIIIEDTSTRLPGVAGSAMEKPTTRREDQTWGIVREHVLQHCEASNYRVVLREKLQRLKQTADIESYNDEYSALIFRVKETELEVVPVAIKISGLSDTYKCVAIVYDTPDEFGCILGFPFFEDMQPQIDWSGRRIKGTRPKTLRWKQTGEISGSIEEGRPVIAFGLRKFVETKGITAKTPDSSRGAALETDVTSEVKLARIAVQKVSPTLVREQQKDMSADKCLEVNNYSVSSQRERTAASTEDGSSSRGKDNIMEKTLAMVVVDEEGVQTMYITRKKLKKFLRIKTKAIEKPDL